MFVYIANICLHYMGWGDVQIVKKNKKKQMIYVDMYFVFCSISL